ncbi:MAG: bile acid:sodium symporter [Terracidiphilus sp.]
MEDIILRILKISIPLSIFAIMFGLGLSVEASLLAPFKERRMLILRSLAVVLLLVPLAVLGIILLMKPAPAVAIGLAILVASPAAPLQLVRVTSKGGNLPYMCCLHLCLALLALITVPITLKLFSLALGFPIDAGVLAVAKVVGITVLAPVGIGILIRTYIPRVAEAIQPTFSKAGKAVLLISALFVIAATYRDLFKMEPWSYFVMAVVVCVSLGIGHLLGRGDDEERTTLAMESASRGLGLALMIATLHFRPDQALPVLLPYFVVFTVISAIYLRWRKRSSLHTSPRISATTQPLHH